MDRCDVILKDIPLELFGCATTKTLKRNFLVFVMDIQPEVALRILVRSSYYYSVTTEPPLPCVFVMASRILPDVFVEDHLERGVLAEKAWYNSQGYLPVIVLRKLCHWCERSQDVREALYRALHLMAKDTTKRAWLWRMMCAQKVEWEQLLRVRQAITSLRVQYAYD